MIFDERFKELSGRVSSANLIASLKQLMVKKSRTSDESVSWQRVPIVSYVLEFRYFWMFRLCKVPFESINKSIKLGADR